MELRQLRYFVEAARLSNFTRAAERLRVAQPALSQQIGNLERELGVALFDRSRRGVKLTEVGEAFLIGAERTLTEAQRAEDEAKGFVGLPRGKVTVGALGSLVQAKLPQMLVAFRQAYPEVEVSIWEETTFLLFGALQTGDLDLAIIHVLDGAFPRQVAGLKPPPGVVVTPLYEDELVLVVAENHPLAKREKVSFRELQEQPFVCFREGSGIRAILLAACAEEGFQPHIPYESTTPRSLVAAGLGVAVLSRSMVKLPGPPVAVVSLEPPLSRSVAIFRIKGRYLSPAAETFLRYAENYLTSKQLG
ncbi:LysR family transcriptional regulator [Desmospora activa]|uniref:DNA-binding transcriptional LysR family regulator n=1 Tax=Desmospora activa DSM 45169 TaxID=1121389 RepID=A0A2T4Z6Y0_9BACL|nr:LysR family transcriptional regulator [Desmospora activa]PTM57653.1 DNA-binding transcriptional LysR family regulator [Desmospora activa DSM 45169]